MLQSEICKKFFFEFYGMNNLTAYSCPDVLISLFFEKDYVEWQQQVLHCKVQAFSYEAQNMCFTPLL